MRAGVAMAFSASTFFTLVFTADSFRIFDNRESRGLGGRPLPEARGITLWLTREGLNPLTVLFGARSNVSTGLVEAALPPATVAKY